MNIQKRFGTRFTVSLSAILLVGCGTSKPLASVPNSLSDARHVASPNRGDWRLAFADEFNGTSLDETKWSIGLPWTGTDGSNRHHNDQYASYIMDDDASVSDGALHLTTQRRDVTGRNGRVFHFTQGLITTRNKFEQTYGYFEARLRFPLSAGPGLWPAFWTLSSGWPPEMDICEVWTSTSRRHQGTAFRGKDGKVNWTSWNNHGPIDPGYTTWAMEWGPGYQIYSQDGVVTNRLHGEHVTNAVQYVLLNSGVESHNPPTDQTKFPNSFNVDYVRVYERPNVPVVLNGSFDSPDEWPWTRYGKTAVVRYESKSPTNCARVDGGDSAFEQTVFGLLPNSTYRVTANIKSDGTTSDVRLGVKEFGGEQVHARVETGQWRSVSVDFSTGPHNTTAKIYCHVPAGGGVGYFDDVSIAHVK